MTDQPLAAAPAPAAPPVSATKVYAPDVPATVELVGIDDQPLFNDDNTPMTMDVIGFESDIAIATKNQQANRRYQQGQRMKITQEGFDADGVNILSKLVVGWNITPSKLVPGIDPGLGEGKVPYSPAAAIAIFKNPKLSVIKDQPDKFALDRNNFLRPSPTA